MVWLVVAEEDDDLVRLITVHLPPEVLATSVTVSIAVLCIEDLLLYKTAPSAVCLFSVLIDDAVVRTQQLRAVVRGDDDEPENLIKLQFLRLPGNQHVLVELHNHYS